MAKFDSTVLSKMSRWPQQVVDDLIAKHNAEKDQALTLRAGIVIAPVALTGNISWHY